MFCPRCETEYREGFETCSDCNVGLVESLEPEEGPLPASLVPLTESRAFELVAELLDRLEKADIAYVIEAGTALHLLGGLALHGDDPGPWEARITVVASKAAEANAILEELQAG